MPLKETLRGLLVLGSLEGVAELAERRRRVLGSLVSLTFDLDPLISWRAVEAMGVACDRLAEVDPESVRQHVRRLNWLITEESGGICWRSPEAMAEVVCRRPRLLADYLPIIVSLLQEMAEEDLGHFRAGILWAIGRLGPAVREHVPRVLPAIAAALDHGDSQVRGMAVWCLSEVGQGACITDRPDLLSDEGPVDLYEEGRLAHTTVGCLARRAVGGVAG